MYAEAKENLSSRAYEDAIKGFEQLEARYPYGRYAEQAQLEIAYAYFVQGEQGSALAACDRFIKLHPYHPNVDYAYYLKGLALQNVDRGLFSWLQPKDRDERDPKGAAEAFESFREIVTRFPNSRYAPDAAKRMRDIASAMARQELRVAVYYLERRAPLAAANRAQVLLKQYPEAPEVEDALGLMVQAYGQLGLADLQADARRVLQLNYPNSKYLARK